MKYLVIAILAMAGSHASAINKTLYGYTNVEHRGSTVRMNNELGGLTGEDINLIISDNGNKQTATFRTHRLNAGQRIKEWNICFEGGVRECREGYSFMRIRNTILEPGKEYPITIRTDKAEKTVMVKAKIAMEDNKEYLSKAIDAFNGSDWRLRDKYQEEMETEYHELRAIGKELKIRTQGNVDIGAWWDKRIIAKKAEIDAIKNSFGRNRGCREVPECVGKVQYMEAELRAIRDEKHLDKAQYKAMGEEHQTRSVKLREEIYKAGIVVTGGDLNKTQKVLKRYEPVTIKINSEWGSGYSDSRYIAHKEYPMTDYMDGFGGGGWMSAWTGGQGVESDIPSPSAGGESKGYTDWRIRAKSPDGKQESWVRVWAQWGNGCRWGSINRFQRCNANWHDFRIGGYDLHKFKGWTADFSLVRQQWGTRKKKYDQPFNLIIE